MTRKSPLALGAFALACVGALSQPSCGRSEPDPQAVFAALLEAHRQALAIDILGTKQVSICAPDGSKSESHTAIEARLARSALGRMRIERSGWPWVDEFAGDGNRICWISREERVYHFTVMSTWGLIDLLPFEVWAGRAGEAPIAMRLIPCDEPGLTALELKNRIMMAPLTALEGLLLLWCVP